MGKPMIDPAIAAFFSDPDGSSVVSAKASQIVAPMVRGEDVKAEELMMGGGIRVVFFVLDRSPSMEDVGDMLLSDFSNEFVPALKAAREDDTSVLRIGGISFSSDITPIWVVRDSSGKEIFFHSLDNLPTLTKADYDPSQGYSTALHAAAIEAPARAMLFAADQQNKMGTAPDIDIVIMSDGANNCAPHDSSSVKTMIQGSDKTRVRWSFFFFETGMGLPDPKSYATKELGIDGENVQIFKMKSGETAEERRKRFRRMMRVMSRVSASKGTSAVQTGAAVATASSSEDIV